MENLKIRRRRVVIWAPGYHNPPAVFPRTEIFFLVQCNRRVGENVIVRSIVPCSTSWSDTPQTFLKKCSTYFSGLFWRNWKFSIIPSCIWHLSLWYTLHDLKEKKTKHVDGFFFYFILFSFCHQWKSIENGPLSTFIVLSVRSPLVVFLPSFFVLVVLNDLIIFEVLKEEF